VRVIDKEGAFSLAAEPRHRSAPNISRYWKQKWETDSPEDVDSDYDPELEDSNDTESEEEEDNTDELKWT
jgi:hypothetical protein